MTELLRCDGCGEDIAGAHLLLTDPLDVAGSPERGPWHFHGWACLADLAQEMQKRWKRVLGVQEG